MRPRTAVVPRTQGPLGGAGNSGVAPTWPMPPIPQHVRDELDQAPAWWVRLFHAALDAVGAERIVYERIETRNWAGQLISVWEHCGYPDCPCSDCRRICS